MSAARLGAGGTAGSLLPLYRNPLRLLISASLWRSAAFLLSYVVLAIALFAIVIGTSTVAATLAFTVIALPLLIAAAWVVHWCAAVQRVTLRLAFSDPVRASYQRAARPGLIANAVAAWRSKATWREFGYLTGLFLPFYALDVIVFTVWVSFGAATSLPLWYRAPFNDTGGHRVYGVEIGDFPNGPHGAGAHGLYVDTLPKALLAAAGFAILFLLFSYVLVLTARAHACAARALLRPPADPLADVKTALTEPGPLGPLTPTSS